MIVEVHAVDSRDRGPDSRDRGPGGDLAHVVVLVDGDLSQPGLHDRDQQIVEGVDLLDDARQVVLHVPEVLAQLLGDLRGVAR